MSTETESLLIIAPDGWEQDGANSIQLRVEHGRVWIYRYPDGSCSGKYCAVVFRDLFDLTNLFGDLDAAIAWSVDFLNVDIAHYKAAIAEKVMEEMKPRIELLTELGETHRIDGYAYGYKNGRIDALKCTKAVIDTMIGWNIEEIAE
jgi:hypothetical protein